ncbi:MAG: hypothetical protein DRJ40_01490 [Thermoprotei archaeon]|nr:MAG: hypothetical protein DRJ40_01490 [Thermoprotei archaeon]
MESIRSVDQVIKSLRYLTKLTPYTGIKYHAIGGTALVIHQVKDATKDIDVAPILDESTYYKLIGNLRRAGLNIDVVPRGRRIRTNIPEVGEVAVDLLWFLDPTKLPYITSSEVTTAETVYINNTITLQVPQLEHVIRHKLLVARPVDITHIKLILQKREINWRTVIEGIREHMRELIQQLNHRSELLGTEFMRDAARNIRRSTRELREQIPENIRSELQEIAKEIEELKKRIRYRAT